MLYLGEILEKLTVEEKRDFIYYIRKLLDEMEVILNRTACSHSDQPVLAGRRLEDGVVDGI